MKLFIKLLTLKPNSAEANSLYALLTSSDRFLFRKKRANSDIELSHDLMRNTKSQKSRTSFYIRKKTIGDGGFGSVDFLCGRIILLDAMKTCLMIPEVKYVAKETDLNEEADENPDESVERALLSSLNLGGQLLAELVRHETFLMKRMKGQDIVNYFENKKIAMSERVVICRALIQAYREQIIEQGIIHRDIKSDNIMLHRGKSGVYVANFVDFQSAVRLKDKHNDAEIVYAKRVGRFANIELQLQFQMMRYPNDFNRHYPYSRAVDLWALNLVFLAIFGVDNPCDGNLTMEEVGRYYLRGKIANELVKRSDIPKNVQKILCKAFSFHESDRYSFEALEQAFEAICPLVQKKSRSVHQAERIVTLQSLIASMENKHYVDLQPLADERVVKLTALTKSEKLTKAVMRKQTAWVQGLGLFADKPGETTETNTHQALVKKK